MKLGNINVFANGSIVIGVKYYQAIYSLLGLLSPVILSILSWVFLYNVVDQNNVYQYRSFATASITIQTILCILTLLSVLVTAFSDPGIVPRKELLEIFNENIQKELEIKQNSLKKVQNVSQECKIEKTSQSTENQDTLTFKLLNSIHDPNKALKFTSQGYKFNAKFCSTCRFFRPLRATHASISNVCIQRYDHFCAWIGTDVALHNHGLFYLMLLCVLIQLVTMLILNFVTIGFSIKGLTSFQVQNIKIQGIIGILLMFLLIFGAGYIIFSMGQLIQYHINLLQTGTLTKEDSGVENAQVSGPFSYFNIYKNFLICMKGVFQQRMLKKAYIQQKYLMQLVKTNPYILNYESLGKILVMNGYTQFLQIILLDEKDNEQQIPSKHFFDEKETQQQLINEKISFQQIVTIKDTNEFAIMRSRQQIVLSKDDLDKLKDSNPKLFESKESLRNKLSLIKVCQKKQKGQKDQQNIVVSSV